MAKVIMVQGTGSNVGKSMIVAGLCRALKARGFRVAPFKPQNMSNNAAVTTDGGEIGRAQALQAMACARAPIKDMNPVLLKPETDIGVQVIVQGQRMTTVKARAYAALKAKLMPKVLESFARLAKDVDFVIVEGAGSPAEINLRNGDIANMGFAEAADIPVILVGDIDRGGVIAQMIGTHAILPAEDRHRIIGFAINKFRGDVSLFDEGMQAIAKHTAWRPLGVIPWFEQAWRLPAEDVMDIASSKNNSAKIKIAVPRLKRIANFDDLDPLAAQLDINVDIVPTGRPLPADADLIIVPGSKSTISDLADFRAQGWDIDLIAHHRRGGHILGICGGYQMLGNEIHDPDGIEGHPASIKGLGLLDVTTVMKPHKRLALSTAAFAPTGTKVKGYEIHIGKTTGPDTRNDWLSAGGKGLAASNAAGNVMGCYMHGLFSENDFRSDFMAHIGRPIVATDYGAALQDTLDALGAFTQKHLDVDAIMDMAVPLM